MATCQFCRQVFRSAQAVRAHLKSCMAYLDLKGMGPRLPRLPREPDEDSADMFDWPVHPPADPMALEPDRLERRLDQLLERELDRTMQESFERQRGAGRRRIIQGVKDEVLGWRSGWGFGVPAEVRARALKELERELSALPVEELPRRELIQIAEGVRDRVDRAAQPAPEAPVARGPQTRERASQGAERKQALIQYGVNYARRELGREEGLDSFDQLQVRRAVERELKEAISGRELEADVRELVDLILDEELGE